MPTYSTQSKIRQFPCWSLSLSLLVSSGLSCTDPVLVTIRPHGLLSLTHTHNIPPLSLPLSLPLSPHISPLYASPSLPFTPLSALFITLLLHLHSLPLSLVFTLVSLSFSVAIQTHTERN
uniref:Uncharacterized protein n=1 Tax=Cacopsylla melanoneura TaxID=428564 RepID=A0A8D8VP60_9HEMI